MYTLGLDTIAGSKLLQVKFGTAAAFQPDQAILHGDRRARFIRISNGTAIIRYWGDSDPVAVPPEALSVPLEQPRCPALRTPAGADARQAWVAPNGSRLVVRAEMGRLPRRPQRSPQLRP